MKKIVSTSLFKTHSQAPNETTPLDLNKLGDMNRNRPANANTKLCDGTPPTQSEVNVAILNRLSIPTTQINYLNFDQMTYGPAIGFPYAIHAVKNIPEISQLCNSHTLILHGGNKTAQTLTNRACKSITGKPQTQINTIQDIPSDDAPTRLTLTLGKLKKCTDAEKTTLSNFINAGNSLVITLDELFPQQTLPIRLSAEIIGNHEVAKQTIITTGYIGPVLEPMAQWLFTLQATQNIHIPKNILTPNLSDITQQFLTYINEETACSLSQGLLAAGGCSGGLFNVAQALDSKKTVIPAPFFGPQKGILQAANHSVSVIPENTPFSEFKNYLSKNDGNIVLTAPNNPDGKIPTPKDIAQLVTDAKENGWTIVLDTTYFNVVREEAQKTFKEVMNLITNTEGLQWVAVSSASKALALTKFRAEFITGDPQTLADVQKTIEPINILTAIALEEGLKPENKETFKAKLMRNVDLNSTYLNKIAAQTLEPETLQHLNSGLQLFDTIVKALQTEFPKEQLLIDTGNGALYAKLIVPEALITRFHELATEHCLALTPGEVFYGNAYTEADNLLIKPQSWYRLSLMSDPLNLPN